MSTTKEVLIKAKEIIQTKGWCRYMFEMPNGSCCMLGAVNAATGVLGEDMGCVEYDELLRARYAAKGALRVVIGGGSIAEFNDAPATSKEDVLAKFDEAIAFAEKEAA